MNIHPHKITIATASPIFPPQNLHANRIFQFYRQIAERIRVDIVSLSSAPDDHFIGIIAPGLSEIRIPKSIAHRQAEQKMQEELGVQNLDYFLIKLWELTPEYLAELKKYTSQAIAVICDQPYLFPAIRKVYQQSIWYEATGIFSTKLLPDNQTGRELAQTIIQAEKQCCHESDLIITTSQHLVKQLTKKYDISSQKVVSTSYGSQPFDSQFISYQQRLSKQEKLGLKSGFLAIYTCAENSNNSEEIKTVFHIASKLPKINFLILGNTDINFNPRLIPPNIDFLPKLNFKTKSIILGIANIALNLTNNKNQNPAQMIEYFLRGVPIISTPAGINSFNFADNQYCLVGETWQFPELILIAEQENITNKELRIRMAKEYITENFTWHQSAHKLLDFLSAQNIAS